MRSIQLAGVLLCASIFPIAAHAACTMPSGSYAGASAGADFANGAGVTGTSFPSSTNYQSSALTITNFPTTTTTGRFKLTKNASVTPPVDSTHNSVLSATGAIGVISGYDASTCSGEIVFTANASVKPVNCNFDTSVAPPVMTCTLGTAQTLAFKARFRFTSSQAGDRITLTPIGYYAPVVFASYFEMWRQ